MRAPRRCGTCRPGPSCASPGGTPAAEPQRLPAYRRRRYRASWPASAGRGTSSARRNRIVRGSGCSMAAPARPCQELMCDIIRATHPLSKQRRVVWRSGSSRELTPRASSSRRSAAARACSTRGSRRWRRACSRSESEAAHALNSKSKGNPATHWLKPVELVAAHDRVLVRLANAPLEVEAR